MWFPKCHPQGEDTFFEELSLFLGGVITRGGLPASNSLLLLLSLCMYKIDGV